MDSLYTVQEVGNTQIAYNATADLFEVYVDNQYQCSNDHLEDAQNMAFIISLPRFDW